MIDHAKCPACYAESAAPSWAYGEFSVVRCRSCDLEFSVPLKAAPLEYYADHSADYVAESYEAIHPGYQFIIHKIDEATSLLDAGKRRVIDIGCGCGYLLIALQRRGYQCLGIDFNEHLVRVAIERFGIQARVDRVECLLSLGQTFDLAILSNVLEHVEKPRELLENIRKILNPGGLVVVEIPNRNWTSIGQSLQRGTCDRKNYPPHHITFWSTASLAKALSSSGFEVVECVHRPFDDMNRVETFLRNRVGVRSGWLFRPAVKTLRAMGKLCGLQGGTLNAVARRVDSTKFLE